MVLGHGLSLSSSNSQVGLRVFYLVTFVVCCICMISPISFQETVRRIKPKPCSRIGEQHGLRIQCSVACQRISRGSVVVMVAVVVGGRVTCCK